MTFEEITGRSAGPKKVRYAVVGAGWIAQAAFLPGVEHTGNSVVTALVTGDPVKARELAPLYDIDNVYSYQQFDDLLASSQIDAIYLSLPNWQHAEFAVRALKAGIHVLCEKPLEVTEEKCQQIIAAQKNSSAKLMVAYRLHFEPATLRALERIRAGEFGRVHHFSSVFAQTVDPSNHRAQHGFLAGPVFDMGPYPINAVRNIFQAEPEEIFAVSSRHPAAKLGDLDDTVAVTMRFPGERTAQFVVSYYGGDIDQYTVFGDKGWLEVNPGFQLQMAFSEYARVGDKEDHKNFPETDHFGGELKYFSDCILNQRDPEPDAEEGWLDVRVILAIQRSLESGKPEQLAPYTRKKKIDPQGQLQELSKVRATELIDSAKPSEPEPPKGTEKAA